MSASIFVQIRSFIFVLIATKALSVEEYGIYTLVMMLVMTAAELSDLGMNSAVTRFSAQYHANKELKKEHDLICFAFKRKFFNAVIVVSLLVVFSKQIAVFLTGESTYDSMIMISSIGVFFALLNGLNNAVLQGRKLFSQYLKTSLIVFVNSLIIISVIYFFHLITMKLLVIYNIAILAMSFILSYFFLKYDLRDCLKKIKNDEVIKNFNSFGRWMFLWAILAVMQSKIDILMLSQLTNITQVAYYDIAMKFTRPCLMIVAAYGQVLNPVMASITSKEMLKTKLKTTNKVVLVMSMGIIAVIFLAPYIIEFIFDSKYINSILPLQILLISLVFYIGTIPYNTALYVMNKPQVFSVAAAMGVIITIVGNYFLLQDYGAVGAAITFLFVQLLGFIISYFAYKKYLKVNGDDYNDR